MKVPKCVKFLSNGGTTANICKSCGDVEDGFDWAEMHNKDIRVGYCNDCIRKYALDSLRGTDYQLKN